MTTPRTRYDVAAQEVAMLTATVPIQLTPEADFEELRKTLVLLPGVQRLTIHPDRIEVRYDPEVTTLGRIRQLVAHKGFALRP